MKLIYRMIQTPTGLVLAGALLGLCLSSYPIIFFGKSYVSPGYGVPMLFEGYPFVTGYQSTDLEYLDGDYGAMPWQNLPYSRVQHEAVFTHGEFPLWNRYNSAGLPLFGQGQSQFLDPLHWIVVVGEGNGWAWDLKFLLSKLIFLAGIGACVFLMTGNRVVTVAVTTSAAFIGFFYFRFNHPVYFNLTYAPWVFYGYLQLVRTIELNRRSGSCIWSALPFVGIFLASVLNLFGGTPKESSILFAALHLAGLTGVVIASLESKAVLRNVGKVLLLWISIGLATTPHWLIFLDTLAKASTVYDEGNCSFADYAWRFIDTAFLGPRSRPWSEPSINTFIFVTGCGAFIGIKRWIRQPSFWMAFLPLFGLLAFAFGIVPRPICAKIPFIGSIHHINHTFFTAAIVFAVLLAGLGLASIVSDVVQQKNRVIWSLYCLIAGALLVFWAYPQYDNYEFAAGIPAMLLAFSIVGVTTMLLVGIWLCAKKSGYSLAGIVVLVVLFLLAHTYHGLHLNTGHDELDRLLINPKPRANLLAVSPAIDSLGYLMPSEITDICSVPGQVEQFVVEAILDRAVKAGGVESEIQRYKSLLRESISSSRSNLTFEGYVNKYPDLFAAYNANPGGKSKIEWGRSHYCKFGRNEGRAYSAGPLIMQRHAANFLRRVGAKRWLDDPVRVIGEGRTLTPGFNSYLLLESLNGPDALKNDRYMDLLDALGWSRLGHAWLRTLKSNQMTQLSPMFDMLNVGYFLTQKSNVNNWTLESDLTDFRRSLAGNNPISLQKVTDGKIDRVGCHFGAKGLASDGKPDNVFLLDLDFPAITAESPAIIHAIQLVRKGPDARYDTGGNNLVLGVSKGGKSELLNQENGRIQISTMQSKLRLWIYFCADSRDNIHSDYRAAIHFQSKNKLPLVVDQDMKVWERKHPWPRAFFVDEVAQYNDVALLAEYIRQADGLPLAAIETPHVVRPGSDRRVVYAQDYKLTANTTSFTVDAPGPGIVVLTEVNIPGDVHVEIDGKPDEVLLVNHAFRAVKIHKPGVYRISFYYRPRLWRISLLLGFVGLIILIGGLVVKLRPSRSLGYPTS